MDFFIIVIFSFTPKMHLGVDSVYICLNVFNWCCRIFIFVQSCNYIFTNIIFPIFGCRFEFQNLPINGISQDNKSQKWIQPTQIRMKKVVIHYVYSLA